MQQEILQIILSALGTILTAVVSFAVAKLTQWLNVKIEDTKTANYMSKLVTIIGNCVNEVTQTYVETLKHEGKFDEEAQKHALQMCLAKIKSQCASYLLEFISSNYGDVEEFLRTMIESAVYTQKAEALLAQKAVIIES